MDDRFLLESSDDEQAWGSHAIAYPYALVLDQRELLFYNGNGFGRSGFGWANRQP